MFSMLQTVMQFPTLSRITRTRSLSIQRYIFQLSTSPTRERRRPFPGSHEALLRYVRYRRRFRRVYKQDEVQPDNRSCW